MYTLEKLASGIFLATAVTLGCSQAPEQKPQSAVVQNPFVIEKPVQTKPPILEKIQETKEYTRPPQPQEPILKPIPQPTPEPESKPEPILSKEEQARYDLFKGYDWKDNTKKQYFDNLIKYGEGQSIGRSLDKDHRLLLVKFCADWCGPCKRLRKNLNTPDMIDYFDNTNTKPLEVDVEKNPDLAKAYGVEGLPYLLYLDIQSGEKLNEFLGEAWVKEIKRDIQISLEKLD